MAGQFEVDVPLAVLFTINLKDTAAIEQRKIDLQRELEILQAKNYTLDTYITCALQDKNFKESAEELLILQRSVLQLRLQFLSLEPEKRAAILRPILEATKQADALKQLQEEHQSAVEEQKKAAKSVVRAEQQELAAQNDVNGDLVSLRADLERTRSEITMLQVNWLSELEKDAAFYQETAEKLAQISKCLLQPEAVPDLEKEYENAAGIWRTLVDKTLNVVTDNKKFDLPKLPEYPEKLISQIGDKLETQQYESAYKETSTLRESLQKKIEDRLKESLDRHNRVLLQSGQIRSQLLNLLLDKGVYRPLSLNLELFHDLRREISIVPYRWNAIFYLRLLEFRKNLEQGWHGLKIIIVNLTIAFVFFLIPWLIWVWTQRLTDRLIEIRADLVRQSRTIPFASHLALLIQKILPYSAWLVMLLCVHLLQYLLLMTVFAELTLLLTYVRYYIYYRLFRQLMQCDFVWINRQIRVAKLWGLRNRVDAAARNLGISLFLIFCLLTTLQSLIRRGLFYHFTVILLKYLGIFIILFLAYQWRQIIAAKLAEQFHGPFGKKLAALCESRWGLLFLLPGILILSIKVVILAIRNWGSHFEVSKRIAAEVFRYKLEAAIEKEPLTRAAALPREYRNFFKLSGGVTLDQADKVELAEINNVYNYFNQWEQDCFHSPNTLAIVGQKGAGKTCLLDMLTYRIPERVTVLRAAVPGKLTTKKQVMSFFCHLFNLPVTEDMSQFCSRVEQLEKTAVLLDDAHNFFLSVQGGFEGYRTVLDLINLSVKNLFWCFAFNHFAWTYLDNVNNRHQYFERIINLSAWSEQSLQTLIMSIHNKTHFNLSYDDILQAVGTENDKNEVSYIENRFFSLLRQQSRGNPRLAIYLWLSSLNSVKDNVLKVSLPIEPDSKLIMNVRKDTLFVLASIVRHENLTLEETVATTQLPKGAVKNILEKMVQANLLDCDANQVYRLSVLYQYPLLNFLLAKHCLYE